jgi:hypothetical protein
MSNKHFKYLVDQAKDLGADLISIFGFGEPLIDPGLAAKVQYCTDKNLSTFITTNAALLNVDTAYKLLKAGLSKIRISMHGQFKTYEKAHRGLSYSRFIRNVTNFIATNDIKFNHRCRTALTVMPLHDESPNLIRTNWEGAVDEMEIWKPHGWAGGKDYRTIKRKKKTCGRPFTGPVQINADGMMMVCCFDFNARMTVGNTHKSTIEQILKGKTYNIFRRRHEIGDMTELPCDTCDQLNEYNEENNPLIYSNVDKERKIGCTSSTKFNLEEKNGLHCKTKRNDADTCGACGS